MKGVLKTFFILLVFAFLAGLTVFLVLFAQGKKLTPRGTFVDTSVLRIEKVPEDAKVYVNGALVEVNDNRVQGIDVGEVSIRVEMEGYSTWRKELILEDNRVETIYPVLVPLPPESIQISTEQIDTVTASDDGNYIYYTTPVDFNNFVTVKRLKISSGLLDFDSNSVAELVGSFNIDLLQQFDVNEPIVITGNIHDIVYSMDISPDNEKVLIKSEELKSFYLINSSESTENINIKQILGFVPEEIRWFGDSNRFIIKDRGLLYEYDLLTNNKTIIYYNPVTEPVFTITGNTVYFYNSTTNTLNIYKNGREEQLVLPEGVDLPTDITELYSSRFNTNILIAASPSNIFYYDLETNFSDVITGANEIVDISPTGDKLLLKDNDSLNLYIVEEKGNNEPVAEKIKVSNIMNATDQYSFTINGTHLFKIENISETQHTALLMDVDGENQFVALENTNLLGTFVFLDRRSENIYFAREDSLLKISLELE